MAKQTWLIAIWADRPSFVLLRANHPESGASPFDVEK
jgi:hypothetical protein